MHPTDDGDRRNKDSADCLSKCFLWALFSKDMQMTPQIFPLSGSPCDFSHVAKLLQTALAFWVHVILIWGVSCASRPGLSQRACACVRPRARPLCHLLSAFARTLRCGSAEVSAPMRAMFTTGKGGGRTCEALQNGHPTHPHSLPCHLSNETKCKCGKVSCDAAFQAGALWRESCATWCPTQEDSALLWNTFARVINRPRSGSDYQFKFFETAAAGGVTCHTPGAAANTPQPGAEQRLPGEWNQHRTPHHLPYV